VLFLLIISRNYFFDMWKWPVSLMIIQGCNVSFALFSALHLRRVAERARQRSLARLNEGLSRELGSLTDGKTNSNRAEQTRLVMRLIESNEEGHSHRFQTSRSLVRSPCPSVGPASWPCSNTFPPTERRRLPLLLARCHLRGLQRPAARRAARQ